MVECSASDLYLTVGSPPAFRIDGELIRFETGDLSAVDVEEFVRSVLSPQHAQEFASLHELNVGIHADSLGRFRVNIFHQRNYPALVVRRINSDIPSLSKLGLPSALHELALLQRGLVLVTGATGSGKSTTLASMIEHRSATLSGHIVTIEDPVEFVHEHRRSIVSQREVGIDTLSFKAALKSALRQAPDVIVLGEVRDAETMEAAVAFAETGHLCLATLHSNNASQAIERVLNFFPAERHAQISMQLALNLRGILSQRLIPARAGARVVACEILLDSPRVKDLIMKGQVADIREVMEKSCSAGMQTFDQHLLHLYRSGLIAYEQALAHADSQNNLRLSVALAQETPLDESLASTEQPLKVLQ
jgi:twitching motility protein PilU